ncbi:MAG: hypothetical protein ACOC1P_01780 [Minisyncoccales bacterium]
MNKQDYFAEGFKADSIARDLELTKEKKGHNPNQRFLEKALETIETMELFDKAPGTNLRRLSERVFYTKILFQEYEEDNRWNIKRKLKEYLNTKNLVRESLSCSRKTIEKLLKGKTPSEKKLEQAKELFNYIADECLKEIQARNPLYTTGRGEPDPFSDFYSKNYFPITKI